jgi:hypothetical protein
MLGEKQHYMGEKPGSAKAAKLVNNAMTIGNIAVGAEAFTMGVIYGADPKNLYNLLTESGGRSNQFTKRFRYVVDNDYTPRATMIVGRRTSAWLRSSDSRWVRHAIARLVRSYYTTAIEKGFADQDLAAVYKIFNPDWDKTNIKSKRKKRRSMLRLFLSENLIICQRFFPRGYQRQIYPCRTWRPRENIALDEYHVLGISGKSAEAASEFIYMIPVLIEQFKADVVRKILVDIDSGKVVHSADFFAFGNDFIFRMSHVSALLLPLRSVSSHFFISSSVRERSLQERLTWRREQWSCWRLRCT